ncbi:Kinesin-like protein KIN-12D [Glycine soja]
MGILLETVTGMHAENGLLSHGLCESNSVISDLKEHNYRTKQELDMCRILKGKLLADIKNSFDRINKKEVEAGEITIKLNNFAKNISDLQLQEEMMLQRSNEMGSQLAKLMRELDVSNTDIVTSLLDQEKLLKKKVVAIECIFISFCYWDAFDGGALACYGIPITLVQVCSQLKFTLSFAYENTVISFLTSLVNSVTFINHNNFTVPTSSENIYDFFQCRDDLANDWCSHCVLHAVNSLTLFANDMPSS